MAHLARPGDRVRRVAAGFEHFTGLVTSVDHDWVCHVLMKSPANEKGKISIMAQEEVKIIEFAEDRD